MLQPTDLVRFYLPQAKRILPWLGTHKFPRDAFISLLLRELGCTGDVAERCLNVLLMEGYLTATLNHVWRSR